MKRIPYSPQDLKKLPDIGRRMFHNVQGFTSSNRDKLAELVAKASFYSSLHDLKAELGKTPLPTPGSIKRVDVQMAFALGLRKLTDLSLIEAFRRAGSSKLRLLSIDELTAEHMQEERLREVQMANPHKRIAVDEAHMISSNTQGWHKDGALLKACGAPPYNLVVGKDGMAFQWSQFTALYDALVASNEFSAVTDKDLSGLSTEQAVSQVVREVLVPESWLPIRDLIREGFRVPYHEAVWLFDASGTGIGRVIRHQAHKGIIPRLLLTDDEVADALTELILGNFVGQGSILADKVIAVRDREPVYAIRQGYSGPKTVGEPGSAPCASRESLEQLPGIEASLLSVHTGSLEQRRWQLEGRYVRTSVADWSVICTGYLMTQQWLTEADFPRLYPNYTAPALAPADMGFDNDQRVVLPVAALSVQKMTKGHVQIKFKAASARLASAFESGELLERLGDAGNRTAMEATAEKMFMTRFLDQLEQMENESGINQSQEAQDKYKAEDIDRLSAVTARLVDGYPSLSIFGHFSLWFALMALHGTLDDYEADYESLEEVLAQLVVLAGSAAANKHRIDYFSTDQTAVAVCMWLDGEIELDDVPAVADDYRKYTWLLERQSGHMERVVLAMNAEVEGRSRAKTLGFAYASQPIPMTKPVTTGDFFRSNRYPRKSNIAVQRSDDFRT